MVIVVISVGTLKSAELSVLYTPRLWGIPPHQAVTLWQFVVFEI